MLGLAIAWVLFVPIADWLAHHDVGSVRGPLHETALDNARGRLLTLGAAVFAAGALVFTARNFTLSRRTLDVTEQGQVTDRYTKAIEQLGSDKLDVRIGGIYALERIARDSPRDHPTVMEVLTAFIREHSHEQWPPTDPARQKQEQSTRPDVQAAATVVGRRAAEHDVRPIDLSRANLAAANLAAANLRGANLDGADLARAWLTSVDLAGAVLLYAKLNSAMLSCADLTKASLGDADLTGAFLNDADLAGANLRGTHLAGARLIDARLAGASLNGADLHGAHLAGADLAGADLARANLADTVFAAMVFADTDLTRGTLHRADLTDARWPKGTPVPEGWERDAGSGRLRAAGAGPETAGAN